MDFKRFSTSDNQWHDVPYYIHNTSTDTITTLPADIYANDTTATVGLKGDMSQTGTPTSTAPIQPQECGERTGNLADLYGVNKTALNLTFTTTDNMKIVVNGTKASGANVINIAYPNIVLPAGTYTVYIKMVGGTITNIESGALFGINGNTYEQRTTPAVNKIGDVGRRRFTLSEDTLLSTLDIAPSYSDVGSVWNNAEFECMLYSGSDDIPYEPYGVKIPISSASTTTPVYLGEVEATRRIKKLVFDGTEDWQNYGQVPNTYRLSISNAQSIGNPAICSHFVNSPISEIISGKFTVGSTWIYIRYADVTDFKAYLAQQYANGTPVTVWYVLASETTGIVNEPIRKIGDYADTVSGITIPTIAGANAVDVLTTLKPSEVSVNYHGWHPVQSVHEAENGAWD